MVDGEVVKDVVTERAQEKAFTVDPKDKWAASDNWDYNQEPFIQTKQALRAGVATWRAGQVGCKLYMPAVSSPTKWLHADEHASTAASR